MQYVFVFFAVATVDVFWTQYFLATREYKSIKGGLYSALIILLGAVSTRYYVHDGLLIIPATLGAFVGTAGTIHYNKRKRLYAPE